MSDSTRSELLPTSPADRLGSTPTTTLEVPAEEDEIGRNVTVNLKHQFRFQIGNLRLPQVLVL